MPTDSTFLTSMPVEQPTQAPAEPASTNESESSEATPSSGFRRLHWDILIAIDPSGGVVESLPSEVTEIFVVNAGTMIAAQGDSDRDAYVYLAVVAELSRIVHIYPEDGEGVRVAAGATARVPSDGWFTVPEAGKVRVVSALRPLSREEIAEALDGRQPPPRVSTVDTRRNIAPDYDPYDGGEGANA
ncbi:hypothetical protein [Sorangium sp. So ce131]|uniref:hypothetical protein n=1 Tax=Sorangium sp. So ce131 TaxID=3133282 RepID=UPI003F5F9148